MLLPLFHILFLSLIISLRSVLCSDRILTGNIAAVLSARVMDTCFTRQLKLGILVGLSGCIFATTWFLLQLPCFLYTEPPIHTTEMGLIISITLAGFFQGLTSPLVYELAAELIYPVKEGMSAGIIVMLLNAAAGVTIFMNGQIEPGAMNLIMVMCLVLVALCVGAVKEQYNRPQNMKSSQSPPLTPPRV